MSPSRRPILAALLVLALVPALLAANVSLWLVRAVADGPTFTASVDLALDDPLVVDGVADRATATVVAAIDALDPLVRGIALTALGLPSDPTTAEVEARARDRVTAILDTSLIREARTDAVLDLHGLLTMGRTGRSDLLVVDADALRLDVRPVVRQALATIDPRLADIGLTVLPAAATRTTLVELDGLSDARAGLAAAEASLPVLVVIVALLALLALVIARDRPGALGWIGLATAVVGTIGIVAVWLAGDPITRGVEDDLLRAAASALYRPVTEPLVHQSVVLVAIGAVLVVNGWVAGAIAWTRERGRRERLGDPGGRRG